MAASYVLLGGGLACTSAIVPLRRQDQEASITLVSEEAVLPYDRPPLSKEFMRGERPRDAVFLRPLEFYQEQRVTLRLGVPARALDVAAKLVLLADGATLQYDKLLLATGGRPRKLDIPGEDLQGVHYLRTLADSEAIAADARPGLHAGIIGAGFIGMEVAASLTQRGVAVTVLEATPSIWSRFLDERLASYFQRYCESRGISFRTGVLPIALLGQERVKGVRIDGGAELPCDLVCIGVGIQPNTELAEQAGLEVNNGVVTNEYLETSDPSVYAGGDLVNYYDPLFQKQRRVEHWGHAEYTGLLAAQNMVGGKQAYDLLSYVWSDIFDLHLEFAGEEKEYDQLQVRGSLEENSFIVLYLKEGYLRAYLAVNTSPREYMVLQRMIKRKVDVSGRLAQLQDTAVELRTLL